MEGPRKQREKKSAISLILTRHVLNLGTEEVPLGSVLTCAKIWEEDSPGLAGWGTDTLESLLEGDLRHSEAVLFLV